MTVRTLADLSDHVATRFPKPTLIRRCHADGFTDISSDEFRTRVRELSVGLQALGVSAGVRVAIMSENRPEWQLADLAILAAGGVTVPIYPTLSSDQAHYILADSGSTVAIVSDVTQLKKIAAAGPAHTAPGAIVVMDARSVDAAGVLSMADLAARGRAELSTDPHAERRYNDRIAAVKPDDLATIIYTSGTTGEPKGVMLTHHNILSNVLAVEDLISLSPDDVALSFLPLSHSFERTVSYEYLHRGVTIAFAESVDTVARDIRRVQPTVMTGVPRVFEKIQARILDAVAQGSALSRAVFRWALEVGLACSRVRLAHRRMPLRLAMQASVAGAVVFAKIRARMGAARLRFMISGSAPLPKSVGEFFHAIGVPIIEGYGLTETSPVLTANPLDGLRFGTVGKAISGVELRIADDGEILARGPNVMAGYYRKPDATKEVLVDGWFHTGDIGFLDSDGYLTITDRKKDLIVTSGGKKIAPQPIENRLKKNPLVAEAIVVGDRRRFPAALIVPDYTALAVRVKEMGLADLTRLELSRHPDIVSLYQGIADEMGRDLAQYERLKRVALLPEEFSIESGQLTPTLKVRRRVVESSYRDAIEALYVE